MTSSNTNVNSVKAGKLLELAHFLTHFQKQYSCASDHMGTNDEGGSHQGASRNILIKRNDLEAVTEYRRDLAMRENLKDHYFVASENSKAKCPAQTVFSLQSKQLEHKIETLNLKIGGVSMRVKRIHRLLQRFEVWTTKMLAQQDLVVSCDSLLEDSAKKTKYSHYAPHLNVPCSDHFCKTLPEISNKEWSIPTLETAVHHMEGTTCTLSLTPNKHTWEEFAKISRMLSLLDETCRMEIYKRSSCIFDIKCKNSYKDLYNQSFEFCTLDLVALWVRARRNSEAMRHMHLLFELQRISSSDGPSSGDVGAEGREQNQVRGSRDKVRAVFKGNPTNARQRICEMTPWVDRLVEWAVTNQTLFSHHHVRSHVQSAFLKRKRKRQDDEEERNRRHRKRARREGVANEEELEQLQQSCLVFILRWFGRRYRKLTSVLYSKKQNILHLDIGCREVDRSGANLLHPLVDEGIHKYLLEPEINGVLAFAKDKTLARIDRRIRNYGNRISLKSQVETLLDALGSAGKSHGVRLELIQAAKSDFRLLHRHYFEEPESPLETASMILDIEYNTETEAIASISDLLRDVPSPWKQHCADCCQQVMENSPLRTCACCESTFHEGCTSWRKESLSDIISSYPPLRQLCAIQLPPVQTLPDFRDDGRVTWTQKEVVVERRLDEFGGLVMALGLSVSMTQSCYDSFNKLTNGTVLDLAKMIAADRSNQKPSFPMALNIKGILIYDVADGSHPGKRAGLQKGDVIQHLEVLELSNGTDIASDSSGRSFDVRGNSTTESRKAFEIPATKIKMRFLRPSLDVVQSSHDWYEQVKIRNKAYTAAMNDMDTGEASETIWYCRNCQDSRTGDQLPLRSMKEEAAFCRTVVRRLGMESYASPFEDEHTEGSGTDPAVSLRRLDAMMTQIMNCEELGSKNKESSFGAFSNPAWGVAGGSELGWATGLDEKPMELLCSGLCVLLQSVPGSANGESRNTSDVTAMFRHFLVAFISWCFLPCKGSGRTVGPPPIFLRMRSPSMFPSCSLCAGRPVAAKGSKVCDHPACCTLARSNRFQMDDFSKEEVSALADTIQEYDVRSSLVGTTFLVHHDDPLVKAVSKVAGLIIDHNQRPVEFVIASYLPKEFGQEVLSENPMWEGDSLSEDDGIFHLLPVISSLQLNYLLDRLTTRQKPPELYSTDDVSWASLEALNLKGVARYSFSELQRKMNESANIRNAIEWAVLRKCVKPLKSSEKHKDLSSEHSTDAFLEFKVSQLEPFNFVAFGNCLTSAASHLLQRGGVRAGNGAIIHRSNWQIVEREGNGIGSDVFGRTSPLPYLGSLSCSVERKYDILIPEGEEYVLVYSDLHFENEGQRTDMETKLRPKILEKPAKLNASTRNWDNCAKTILMVNHEPGDEEPGYQGIGWGFELVRWDHEEALRVGRICSPSPAQRAGLQTNDIIAEVSGRKLNSFDHANLISAILGASNVCVSTKESLVDPVGTIPIVLGNVAERCKLDPVVLKVYRPSQESDDENDLENSNLDPTQRISESRKLNSAQCSSNFDDDDEVVVLGFSNPSNKAPNALPPTNPNGPRALTVAQQPSRQPSERAQNSLADSRLPLKSLYTRVHTYYGQRSVISMDQLYFAAKNGVVFTLAETAVFLECFKKRQPQLGIRLLCPRYTPGLVYDQIKVIARWPVNVIETIPKLTNDMFRAIIGVDYDRAKSKDNPETGGVVFREVNPEAMGSDDSHWEYRYPVDRLPIDRCLERVLADLAEQERMSHQVHYQPQHHHYGDQQPAHYMPPPNGMAPPAHYGQPPNQLLPAEEYQAHQNSGWQSHHYMHPPNPLEANMMGHQVYDNSQAAYNNAGGERIRGGGTSVDDEKSKKTLLSDTPVEKWDGLPVYMFVQPEELQGDKLLVGFVKPARDVELVSEMKVDVEGHYLEDFGEFEQSEMLQAPSNEVFVIDMQATDDHGRHAVSVIRELYAQRKGPSKNWASGIDEANFEIRTESGGDNNDANTECGGRSVENCASSVAERPQASDSFIPAQQTELTSTENETIAPATPEASGNSRTKSRLPTPSLIKMKDKMNHLGELPDGRDCLWIANDPGAIYITTDELEDSKTTESCQQKYSHFLGSPQAPSQARLVMRDSQKYHCPWGSSVVNDDHGDNIREALSFISQEDLINHCRECFSYEKLPDFVDIGRGRRCIRIPEGEQIRDLYCDLSAALYVRSSAFDFSSTSAEQPMKTTKSGTRFSQSPTGKPLFLVIDDKLSSNTKQLREALSEEQSTIVCALVELLETMFGLFEVEESGNLRLTDEELLKYCSVEETTAASASMSTSENERMQDRKTSSKDSLCFNCAGCDLCTLPWEKTVRVEIESAGDDSGERFFGSGCSLINKLIRNSEMPKALPGSLGEAKVLLMELGEIVPYQLKFRGRHSEFDYLAGHRLWDENNHNTWKRFVTEATCTKQLSQAYVTLLGSIDRSLLPDWWRTEGAGWSTTQVLLVNGKLALLLLHVYVLDAAIADYMCQELYKKSTATASSSMAFSTERPEPKVKGTAAERMKKYMEFAQKQGWPLFEGINGSDCCICSDGGDLLCCDLCPKVQHAGCCTPRIEGDPKSLDTFICQVCINDIEEEMEDLE